MDNTINIQDIYKLNMSAQDFERLSTFIYKEYGIKMPPAKKTMLQSRLHKRLRELGMTSYKQYIDFVFSAKGKSEELFHMIDEVSTNKTDFFREPSHFDYLTATYLPHYVSSNQISRPLKVWSAGCSSGEEPYTLSIVLSEFAEKYPSLNFNIFATDISTKVLEKASLAIYPEERIEIIPLSLKRKYFLKSKDEEKRTVRIIPALRKKIIFQRLNFMDQNYPVHEAFDVIFCRNVLIYFDRETQESVINKLCTKLKVGGFFFLGHSESITSMNVPLAQVKPTIFRRI